MKKLFQLGLIFFLMGVLNLVYGATVEVKEVARSITIGPITVSTMTVSTMTVNGSTNYSGRYKITIENSDPTYAVAIGTSPGMTFAAGYILTRTTEAFTSVITLPLNSGTTVWAIGQGNSNQATINTRIIEYK